MSLAAILKPPPTGDRGMNEWLFAHLQDHLDIIQKIQAATGIVLPVYSIDPLPLGDTKSWLLRHQNLHTDMGQILGIDSSDLETVDWESKEERDSFYWMNFEEHKAAHRRLGS